MKTKYSIALTAVVTIGISFYFLMQAQKDIGDKSLEYLGGDTRRLEKFAHSALFSKNIYQKRQPFIENWWYDNASISPGKEALNQAKTHASKLESYLNSTELGEVSELSKKVTKRFNSVVPLLYVGGGTSEVRPNSFVTLQGNRHKKPERTDGTIFVGFYAEEQRHMVRQRAGLAFYDSNTGILILPGCDYPEAFLAGLFFHEAGHAALGVNNEFDSDPWKNALEEVVMHQLEGDVMNGVTNGRYFDQCRKILGRFPESQHPIDVITAIRSTDYRDLNIALGFERSNGIVTGMSFAQHRLMLSFMQVERRGEGLEERACVYHILRTARMMAGI